jgi:PAS domain S-box-containing protein
MWVNVVKYEGEKAFDITVLGINEKLREISNKEIKENYTYKIDNEEYDNLNSIIENLDKDKKTTLVDFVQTLESFYQIDINYISENKYIIWFTKKIELDENIKILLEKMDAYIWCKDTLGRYVYTNMKSELYLNANEPNIIGKNDFEVFPEEIANTFVASDKKLLNSEKESIQALTFFNEECYDGLNHLIKNENGDILGTIGICIDTLRQRKYITNAISDAKMLELISDTIPDSIFYKDNNGIFRHCNKVFAENRNLEKEDVIGKTEKDIGTPDEKIKKYDLEDKEIMKSKKSSRSTHSWVSNDGRTTYFETIKVPFVDENQMVGGVLGISRDISHRKEAELEFERLRIEFFANLSHEFKTPLNLIFSSIQLIEFMIDRGENSIDYKNYTKIIKQNGYRLLKMVNNLIDSTRLSSGCLEYNPQNYNIVEFVENICESVQYYANQENIQLIFDTNLEERVMAFDLEKMERIILNLLSNSIKYNKEKGNIEVSLNFEKEHLYIKVKDSGVGIPGDKLDEVFKLFKQINNRITKLSEGSGIGLSIVKSLVDLHNGSINVHSKEGIGSEFTIKLPINTCRDEGNHKKPIKYNRYVETIDIEFSDIYTSIKV